MMKAPSVWHFSYLVLCVACVRDHSNVSTAAIGNGATATGSLVIEPAPTVLLPADTGDEKATIGYAVGATRISDDRILVADTYEQSIRTFDHAGRLTRSTGRRGGGPGEFVTATWFGRCGDDSVFVWDDAQQRVSVFDGDGKFARLGELEGSPVVIACSSTRMFATLSSPGRGLTMSASSPTLKTHLMLADANGDSLWSIADVPLGRNRPLSTLTRLALSRDRLYLGTGDSAFVDEYDLSGRRIRTFQVADSLRHCTPLHYDRGIDLMLARMPGDSSARESIKRMLLAIPMPEYLPPYSALLTDPRGALWVVTTAPGDGYTELRSYQAGGVPLGTVRFPFEMRILEVGSNYILGSIQSDTGQERLALYEYTRN